MENKGKHGGAREGGGRPTKIDEEQKNNLFIAAVKELSNKDNEEEAKIFIIKNLFEFERGKMFIAEHLFGKPKETIDATVKNSIVEWVETKTYDSNQETD